jgi:hypothetical protein
MKLAKIIRFTDLSDGLIARFDQGQNILFIDREIYGRLTDLQRQLVYKTTDECHSV